MVTKALYSQFDPVECTDEDSGGQKVASELVISGGDAPPIFDATEIVLDLVAPAVEALRAISSDPTGAAAGNDRQSAFVLDLLTDGLAVIGLVAGDGERWPGGREDIFDHLVVMDLSASHDEVQRATLAIDHRVDFRGPPAAADTNRLVFLPPFAPLAAR